MSFLVLEQLDKRFGSLQVLDRVSLQVEEGEVLALLGPSGSGKTTLLRLLAGFETPDGGRVRLRGDDLTPLPPERRRFGMVFQHYALFPHLTVGENVAFGLESRRLPAVEVERLSSDALRLVDLEGFEPRRPGQISGGQQQRVALARALAIEPRVLLLDEPLSNLDPALRERTRRELKAAIRRVGITTVLVTHEQEEAFHLGDRVAVLHRGRLDQVGTPEELYERPATRFVATFVGSASVLPGRAAAPAAAGDALTVRLDGSEEVQWPAVAGADLDQGAAVEVVVRPESLCFADPGDGLPGRVSGRRYAGTITHYRVELVEPAEGVDGDEDETPDGRELEVAVRERDLAGAGTTAAAEGDRVAVAVLPDGTPPRAFPTEDGR